MENDYNEISSIAFFCIVEHLTTKHISHVNAKVACYLYHVIQVAHTLTKAGLGTLHFYLYIHNFYIICYVGVVLH